MIEPTEFILSTSPFVVRRRVRCGERDPAGVVYTGKFTDYLLSSTMLFHDSLLEDFSDGYRKKMDIETPCKSMTLTFSRALWPNETFDIHVAVADIRTSSYDVQVRAVVADGSLVFTGQVSMVCIPRDERKSIPIPPDMRTRLEAARAPATP